MIGVNFSIALAASLNILVNTICAIFLLKSVPLTEIKTLLRFHNLRAVILIVLCMIAACEISVAYLLMTHTNDEASSSYETISALAFFVSIISTAILLRLIEVRKSHSAIKWIYIIAVSEIFLTILRGFKWTNVQSVNDVTSLNFAVQTGLLFFSFALTATDISTIYFESSLLITSKSCDPTLLSRENVTYKSPYSTFLSKMTFWWLLPLLCKGFLKPLEIGDLGNLAEKETSRYHYDQFLFIYKAKKGTNKTKGSMHSPLWMCYVKSCWKIFIISGIFKLFGDLCGLIGPLSIPYIVDFINLQTLQHENASGAIDEMPVAAHNFHNDTANIVRTINNRHSSVGWLEFVENGWIMSCLVLISFLMQGTFSQASTNLVNMEGIKIKNALQGLIYRKMLLLNVSCCFASETKREDENCIKKGEKGDEKNVSAEEDVNNPGTITNLMSEDSLNVMSFFWIAHYVWSIPLKIAIVVYFLYLKLGVSSLIGSTVTIILMVPLQFLCGRNMSRNSEHGAKRSDERLKKIREIFLRIKLIKLNAWEEIFIEKIAECRRRELRYLNIDAFYWTLMTFLTHISSILITIVTFAAYTMINDESIEFNSSNVFTALALFNQLTVPLFIFPITIPIIISSLISTRRIERFLSQPEIEKEFEGVKHMARVLCKNNDSLDDDQKSNNGDEGGGDDVRELSVGSKLQEHKINEKLFRIQQDTIDEEEAAEEKLSPEIKINLDTNERSFNVHGTVAAIKEENEDENECQVRPKSDLMTSSDEIKSLDDEVVVLRNKNNRTKLKKQNQLSESMRSERNRLRSTKVIEKCKKEPGKIHRLPSFRVPDGIAICINSAKFSWDGKQNSKMLEIENLSIPLGVLTVIVGKSGSGKSSIVGAVLKEMQIHSGTIEWNKYATIAYSAQQPFLQNTTIRDNILFGESYHPKRYEKTIETCALKADIESMPNGDLTQVGERGHNLSGGQKMRISLARAFYSPANVIILDDAFSSLDNEVVSELFEKCIKRGLSKYKRTIILVTQKTQLVYSADYLIAMENMKVRSAGTIKVIKDVDPSLVGEWDAAIAKENAKENAGGRNAKERWKLFKNISRFGILQQQQNQPISTEEDNLSSHGSLYNPFKRTSGGFFGSRLWSDLALPMDECNDSDFDFPILRKKNDNEKVLRVTSLQPNATQKIKQPLARHISSPTRFNYSMKVKADNNRMSDNSFGSKVSFRGFIRRMSERRRKPTGDSDYMRERRRAGGNAARQALSIRSINEEEVINNSFEERDENEDRVVSFISKCSEESDDDASVNLDEDGNELNRLKSDEERKYGKIPARIYLLYLRACGTVTLVVFFMSTLLWQALKVYTDVWLRKWTDDGDTADVKYYFNVYSALSALCIFFALIATPSAQIAGNNSRKSLHEKLVDAVMHNPIDFFQSTPFGRIINRFSFDMGIIDKKIATTSQRLLQFILLCSCAVLINAAINKWFIPLTIPILVIYYFVQKFYRESTRELQRIESISNAPVFSHFSETFLGLTTIRAYNQESRFMEMLFKRMEENNVSFVILNCSNRWLGIALDYLGAIIVFIAILTALITSYLLPNEASPSLVAMALQYTLLIPIYLNWVVQLSANMEMYFGACERISYCIENGNQEEAASAGKTMQAYESLPAKWPQYGNIEFCLVSLKYVNQNDCIIKDLSINIPAGQRIGICGRTGSGKSSLANSLFGVVEINSGQIFIDSIDISKIRMTELRSRLSIILQEDGILFQSTVRENLDPHSRFSDMELWKCLETVHLKGLISSLPNKLDTCFSESGALLSFGQRQLFCLARAVLKGSSVLVLDEATSNLDYETELLFLNAANNAFKGKTVITIAHRLYSLLDYDRVVIMENGKIIEDGNPKELKANPSSTFTTMLNASDLSSKRK